jgi:hypothetical protein
MSIRHVTEFKDYRDYLEFCKTQPCRFFRDTGACSYGDACRYQHSKYKVPEGKAFLPTPAERVKAHEPTIQVICTGALPGFRCEAYNHGCCSKLHVLPQSLADKLKPFKGVKQSPKSMMDTLIAHNRASNKPVNS